MKKKKGVRKNANYYKWKNIVVIAVFHVLRMISRALRGFFSRMSSDKASAEIIVSQWTT